MAAGGYVLKIKPERLPIFEEYVEAAFFAEAVPEFAHSRTSSLICFVSTEEGKITHLAAGRRGVRAGTLQSRLNLSDIHPLSPPLQSKDIIARVPSKVRRHVASALEKGGILPPKSFVAVVDAILAINPNARPLLQRFSAQRRQAIRSLSARAREALSIQKEAVNTALNIAGLDRKPLLEWTPIANEAPKSFLDGLPSAYLREDLMIARDASLVPGLEQIRTSITGVARFENDFVALEVIVANRTALEEQTGTDLIYYNATYDSFVMVQYKAMEKSRVGNQVTFRLPNTQLAKEIIRMDQMLAFLGPATTATHRHGYRLSTNPFVLKLCPRIVLNPDDVGLTPGMYITRDHWRFFETDGDLLGERGGRNITYANAGRYLNNGAFAALVRGAWIGTTPSQSAKLYPMVKKLLTHGKAAIIAIKTEKEREREPPSEETEDFEL